MERYMVESICESEELQLVDPDLWQEYVDANAGSDYGSGIVAYAERWAKIMQYAIEMDGFALEEVADRLSDDADFEGITGAMYNAAVTMLVQCWKYGEELRAWHNAKYGAEGADGLVNSSILTIG